MAASKKADTKAAQAALEILLNILPRSERGIQDIAYLFGLICRDSDIPVEQATIAIMSWSERLRALPNFKELYPSYSKLSFYRYRVRYAAQSAYKRRQASPSYRKFRDLTGQEPPAASFWTMPQPSTTKQKPGKRPAKDNS